MTIFMDRLVLFTKLLLDYCLSLITPEIISFFSKSFLVLTYRHELGMNYNFIRPDLIVGSCLQVLKYHLSQPIYRRKKKTLLNSV